MIAPAQKIGFSLLLVFGLLTVGLGFLQLRNTIYLPFANNALADATGQKVSTAAIDELTAAQRLDTDHDGLSDYDENNFYGTSQYIPDTDSDGTPDGEEVKKGTDPLCAAGKVCETAADNKTATSTASTTDFSSPLLQTVSSPVDLVNAATPKTETALGGSETTIDVAALANNPAAVRKLLKDSGQLTDADLAKLTDAELLAAIKSFIPASPNATFPTSTITSELRNDTKVRN